MNKLKQAYVPLAKSYAKVPSLSHWYLNLPMRVATSFKTIKQLERDRARLELDYKNNPKGAMYK